MELTLNVHCTTVIFVRTFNFRQSCTPFDSGSEYNKTQHGTTCMQNTTARKQIYLEFRMNLSPQSIHVKHLTDYWQYWRRASATGPCAHHARTHCRPWRGKLVPFGGGLPASRVTEIESVEI